MAALGEYLKHPKCVALGEIGLDYYWKPYNREKQLELFRRQLDMAIERDMPVSMHIREAYGDCMEVLESYGGRIKGVMHCFSGSAEIAEPLRRAGAVHSLRRCAYLQVKQKRPGRPAPPPPLTGFSPKPIVPTWPRSPTGESATTPGIYPSSAVKWPR